MSPLTLYLGKAFGVFLLRPKAGLGAFYRVVRTPERFRMFMVVDFALSVWLTWIAFTA